MLLRRRNHTSVRPERTAGLASLRPESSVAWRLLYVGPGETAKGRAASAAEGGERLVRWGREGDVQAARQRCLYAFVASSLPVSPSAWFAPLHRSTVPPFHRHFNGGVLDG